MRAPPARAARSPHAPAWSAISAVAVLTLASVAAHAEPAPPPHPITTLSPMRGEPAPQTPAASTAAVASSSVPPATPSTSPRAPIAAIDPAPRFELIDRGDAVEVIAHHIRAARTAVLPVRSRLEVPLAGAPQARRITPADPTVKLIELGDDAIRTLSVKLAFERADVKALSRFAQAIQVGDDLHLLVPRKLPDGGVAPRLPEPTMPAPGARTDRPAAAAHVEPAAARTDAAATHAARVEPAGPPAAPPMPPTAPVLGPRADPRGDPPPAAAAAPTAPTAPTAPSTPARPEAAAARHDAPSTAAARTRSAADALSAPPPGPPSASVAPPRSLDQTLAADRDDAWSRISMYGALGLAAAGAGVWLLRRRRGRPGLAASIEIIAQRSLGGKARIVWLSAGTREMIVSVTAQQVRMLGQWRKSDVELPPAYARDEPRDRSGAATGPATGFAAPRAPTGQFAAPRSPTGQFTVPAAAALDNAVSPAVSGLLRLRGRTGQIPAVDPTAEPRPAGRSRARLSTMDSDLPADVEPDSLWAKEILAATIGRPGVRS
ncbi:MAG: flagellar biosynthetic protein FliO [Deltaproteobacteria bacterium]|nr:MAG: flagellar biosynthetic protein FliO [Deltaproteobacteria bacterium]